MKKFVNDPKDFVPEMLKGIALANPDTLKYIPEYNLIMRKDIDGQQSINHAGLRFQSRTSPCHDRW